MTFIFQGTLLTHDPQVLVMSPYYANIGGNGAKCLSLVGRMFSDPKTSFHYKYLFDENNQITGLSFVSTGYSDPETIVIPEGVTSIGAHACSNNPNLKSLTIPSTVISIGVQAFSSCKQMTNIIIPDGVKTINQSAFYIPDGGNITIPSSVTYIQDNALGFERRGSGNIIILSCDSYAYQWAKTFKETHSNITLTVQHKSIFTDAAIDPTTEETGLTEGEHCSVCGEILIPQEIIPVIDTYGCIDSTITKEITATAPVSRVESSDDSIVSITYDTAGMPNTPTTIYCTGISQGFAVINLYGSYFGSESKIASFSMSVDKHKEVIDKAVEATCTETGLTEGSHCSVCNEVIKKQEKVAAFGHKEVIDKAVEATTEKTGLTEGKHCERCGEVLVAQKVIPKTDPIAAFVTRCYQLILNREPDSVGLKGWSEKLKNKTDAAANIIDQFVQSPEYINRNLSNAESVEILYNAMLDRKADEGGKAGWLDLLGNGATLRHVINGFCSSEEFATLCKGYDIEPGTVNVNPVDPEPVPDTARGKIEAFVKRCYKLIMGRDGEAEGVKYWSDALETNTLTAAEIIDNFVRSQEYINRDLGKEESVEILYNTMMDRKADEGGKAYWVGMLEQGYSLPHVINGFCGSQEFFTICESFGIRPGSVAVGGVMVKREAITPEGEEEAPVVYVNYSSEYTNEEKVRAFAEHCYEAVFGRKGDAEGTEAWTKQILDGEKTPKRVAYEFIFSDEFRNNLPGNESFIRILYRLYFNREADAEGLAMWVAQLEAGTSLEEIVNGFANSAEFKVIVNSMKE